MICTTRLSQAKIYPSKMIRKNLYLGMQFVYSVKRLVSSTVNEQELSKFRAMSQSWWDRNGEAKALHSLNKLRVPFIRDGLISSRRVDRKIANGPKPLQNLSILDVGCGGGILSESLAYLGANVTGIDAVSENISVAQDHAFQDKNLKPLNYVVGIVEDHQKSYSGHYDAVVASEVLEHVENPAFFISTCSALLKPGGSLFVTTINRTQAAWMAAILVGEYIFRIIPRGTHDWNKFVAPDDLESMLEAAGCKVVTKHGMLYNVVGNGWMWTGPTPVNYAVHALKVMERKDVEESPEKQDEILGGDRRSPLTIDVTDRPV